MLQRVLSHRRQCRGRADLLGGLLGKGEKLGTVVWIQLVLLIPVASDGGDSGFRQQESPGTEGSLLPYCECWLPSLSPNW